MKYTEEKATVVLISDGKETCNLDPCEVGRSLKEKGIDFTAHVISFDVPATETAGLRCLARETGGLYLEAKNADELKDAFGEASEIITDVTPIKISDATIIAPAEVIAGSVFDAQWSGPKNRLDRLVIKSSDGKKSYGYEYIGGEEQVSPANLTAPEKVGVYHIHYHLNDGRSLAKTAIRVIPATARVSAPEQIAAGSKFPVDWSGPKNKFDMLKIFSADGKRSFAYEYIFAEDVQSPAELIAPEVPGTYEVRYYTHGKNTLAKQTIQVVAASASVSAPEQIVAGSKFPVDWSGPKNKFDMLKIFSADGKRSFAYEYIFAEDVQSPTELTAPEGPGTYEVRYFTHGKNTLAKQTIQVVAASASVSAPEQIVAGSKFPVDWNGPKNKFDMLKIFSADGKRSFAYEYIFAEDVQSPTELTAPEGPGTYEVRYYTHGKNTLAKQTIQVVAASASVSAPEQIVAGSKFPVDWSGPKNKFDMLKIFSADGKRSFAYEYIFAEDVQSPAELIAPEVPGTYEVRYYTHGKNTLAKQTIQVVAASASVSAPE